MSRVVNDLLRLNIVEAYLGDSYYHLKDNALAASALLHDPDMPVSVRRNEDGMSEILVAMDQFYDALYFNWNLTFITVASNIWLTMAKLLQPLVACADPRRFIIVRAVSLKIAIQTTRWSEFLGQPYVSPATLVFTPQAREAMAKINRDAAETYVKSCGDGNWKAITRNFSMRNFIALNKSLFILARHADFLWRRRYYSK
jgi:hypothetical protein